MTAILFATLFALGAAFAAGSIFLTVRSYGHSALALRKVLQQCSAGDEIHLHITEVKVSTQSRVLHPNFNRRITRPADPRVLRAAA